MSLRARAFMSPTEARLCRAARILFFVLGFAAATTAIVVWTIHVFLIIAVLILLYLAGDLLWERVAKRILDRRIPLQRRARL